LLDKLKGFDFAQFAFWAAVAVVVFLVGGVFGEKQLPPYRLFSEGYKSAKTVVAETTQVRHGLVQKIQYAGDGVTRHDASRSYNGFTLIQGLFPKAWKCNCLI
jgi:hypothetical protein